MHTSHASHTWKSHVKYIEESCHAYEWVMSHTWISHGRGQEGGRGGRRHIHCKPLATARNKKKNKNKLYILHSHPQINTYAWMLPLPGPLTRAGRAGVCWKDGLTNCAAHMCARAGEKGGKTGPKWVQGVWYRMSLGWWILMPFTVIMWLQFSRLRLHDDRDKNSDKAPTNKIYRRASSEQRPRTTSCHESERLV